MSLREKTISGAKWSAIATVIIIGLGLVQMTVLARIIDNHQFGLLTVSLVIIALADTLSDFGIANSIIQRKEISHLELTTLYWLNVGLGIVVCVAVFLLSDAIGCFVKKSGVFVVADQIHRRLHLCAKAAHFARQALDIVAIPMHAAHDQPGVLREIRVVADKIPPLPARHPHTALHLSGVARRLSWHGKVGSVRAGLWALDFDAAVIVDQAIGRYAAGQVIVQAKSHLSDKVPCQRFVFGACHWFTLGAGGHVR